MAKHISKILSFLVLFCVVKGDSGHAEGKDYLKSHGINTSYADIVFLLDRSGSVGAAGFETELGFVEGFLSNFVVAPNATRVAVISFSDDAKVHTDHLKGDANKCLLAQDLQSITYTDSRATNTGAGLLKALDVFKKARADTKKILVLVTDGLATLGPDPVEAAARLKKEGVQVHVFGVGRYLKSHLKAIASSHKHVHESESFTKLRNMYGNGMKDQWNTNDTPEACNTKCHSKPGDPGCCDANAICGCSLTKGVNDCLCKPGYIGNGLKGECKPCESGFYQDQYGQLACKPCPVGSKTYDIGSSSVDECKCLPGYNRSAGSGVSCTVVTCPPLQAPVNGKVEGEDCGTEYQSECQFQCNEGYMLEDKDSEYRWCQHDGTWSGKTPVCIPLRCDDKPILADGFLQCPDQVTVNTTCTYKCHRGHTLKGPSNTTCVGRDVWSGKPPRCELVGCGDPPRVQHSRQLRAQFKKDYKFGEFYAVECGAGFKRVGTPVYVCDHSGSWKLPGDPQPPQCIDVTPPTIICPKDITLSAEQHRKTAKLSWQGPQIRDNSKAHIIPTQEPAYPTSPATLEIGTHLFVYRAVDPANLTSTCTMQIEILDSQSPQVTYCPSAIQVNTTDLQVSVRWKEPEFIDNSGGNINVTQSHRSGQVFNYGTHQITYRATDPSNNVAYCRFNVHVWGSRCPYYPPPRNGALVCEEFMYGDLCQVLCNDRYYFVSDPADEYICDNTLKWSTEPEGMPVPWPDCSVTSPPHLRKRFEAHYFTGDCRDPQVQDTIRNIFKNNFENFKSKAQLCGKEIDCKLTSIAVYCGATDGINRNGRGRRSVSSSGERYSVAEVDAELHFTRLMNDTTDIEEFSESVDTTFTDLGEVPEYILDDVIAETNVSVEMKLLDSSIKDTFLVCGIGKVLNGQQCVMCPVGTYHDKTQDLCAPCARGKYQDEEGSTLCKPCPANTMTETLKSSSLDDCRAVCTEGTYSFTGMETCIACPRGTYQDEDHQTFCKACPMGTTTEMIGSTSIQDCKLLCSPGSMSESGLEPCRPCDKGFYQAYNGQRSCDECIFPLTTLEKGSNSSIQCEEHDHCLSEPCKNNGTCESSRHDFTCSCPPEFYGKVCDLEKTACSNDICLNGGSCKVTGERFQCVCTPDYEGERCEMPRDLCLDTVCLHGGECVIEDERASCQCVPGYVGDVCQHRMDVM
ncbi:sushi, von Willebrand factor type A, EGF and pentraxin domain-containing protein 1-like [Ornithodoros turicata]